MDSTTDWPTPQDYNEAIQHPESCFADLALKSSRVELNQLGLPRPMTGAFASVYRLVQGERSYAVRCFLEPRIDAKDRYAAISDALQKARLDSFADFFFLEKGIQVKGQWFPILRMEWIEGESLEKYIERNFRSQDKMLALHKEFRKVIKGLARAGIAHGDLQHGNILVSDEGMKLIDYDGMFVAALEGFTSPELGHRNFQHPDRGHDLFDSSLDNFSSWIIDTSLKLLIIDPALWKEHSCGDDALIFRHKDLRLPDESSLFASLLNHQSEEIVSSVELLKRVLDLRPDLVPDLSADIDTISGIFNRQSIATIAESERTEFGEATSPGEQSSNVEPDELAVEYERWLQGRKQGNNRRRRGLAQAAAGKVANHVRGIGGVFWKAGKGAFCFVAPEKWADSVLAEADQFYGQNDYVRAIQLYDDVAEFFHPYRLRQSILCTALIRLGYCYADKQQLGTSAHYFREAQKKATSFDLPEMEEKALMLLSASYYELGQSQRAIEEFTSGIKSLTRFASFIDEEKSWAFGRRLTLTSMFIDLGHSYLRSDKLSNAFDSYEIALKTCQWIDHPAYENNVSLLRMRALSGLSAARLSEVTSESGNVSRDSINEEYVLTPVAPLFRATPGELETLLSLETDGYLSEDESFADLLLELACRFEHRGDREKAEIAFRHAARIFSSVEGRPVRLMKTVECYLGLREEVRAVELLSSLSKWPAGFSERLSRRVQTIKDFKNALSVATVVYESAQLKQRYHCLAALANGAPYRAEIERCLEAMIPSPFSVASIFGELMLDLARELKERNRTAEATVLYTAAFNSFKNVGLNATSGGHVMECILAFDDLDLAASLLLESGQVESVVRLMVNVMVKQGDYNQDLVIDLVARILRLQLDRPVTSVSREEVNETLEVLKWCASGKSEKVDELTEEVENWTRSRDLSVAHVLVEQGKFASALSTFEEYEGPTGENVIAVLELWIMKYMSVALISGDRSFVPVADGYAFGCAVELIRTLKERKCLSPAFASQLAELIKLSNTTGTERFLVEIKHLLQDMGEDYQGACDTLARFSRSDSSSESASKVRMVVTFDTSNDLIETSFDTVEDTASDESLSAMPPPPPVSASDSSPSAVELWRELNRVFVLIDREQRVEAINDLRELQRFATDPYFLAETYVAMGYCCILLGDEPESERVYKKALRITRRGEPLMFARAAMAVAILASPRQDRARMLRMLADPMLARKDLYKMANQLFSRNIPLEENFSWALGDALYERGCEQEKANLFDGARRNYRAALAVYGEVNQSRWSEVVDCFDAINNVSRSARVLRLLSRGHEGEPEYDSLLFKLAARRINNKGQTRAIEQYESQGIPFKDYIDRAQQKGLLRSLKKALTGHLPPTRLFLEIHASLEERLSQGKLDGQFATDVGNVVSTTVPECDPSRRRRCEADLLKIADTLAKSDVTAASLIRSALETARQKEEDDLIAKSEEKNPEKQERDEDANLTDLTEIRIFGPDSAT